MRLLIFTFSFLFSTVCSFSQLLTIEEIDNSDFPIMRAKFYATKPDATSYISIAKEEFYVTENGIPRKVDTVICNSPNLIPVSLTLSLDDSGSMDVGDHLSDVPRELQNEYATTLTKAIVAPPSEIALQFADNQTYLKVNFTKNKDSIYQAISKMTLGGSNNFTEHLMNEQTGAIAIAKRGKYKRYIVMITDGQGGGLKPADSVRCIDSCKKNNINLIVIVLSASIAPPNAIMQSLAGIVSATGGEMITNIFSSTDAYNLAIRLQEKIQSGKPCEITWQSDSSCIVNRKVSITVPTIPLYAQTVYEAPESSVRKLEFQQDSIAFGFLEYGLTKDVAFTITAQNYPVTISKIQSEDVRFSIADYGGTLPLFELQAGETRVLVIRFSPADSGFSKSEITILHNACNSRQNIIVAGGYIDRRPYTRTLRVAYPNGGEFFGFGETIAIRWEGALPQDTMRLEYSGDHGATWRFITDTATNLQYTWRIPPDAGNSYSIRVTQIRPYNYIPQVVVMPNCLAYSWSNDGKRLLAITTDSDSAAKVYYAATGQVQYSIKTSGLPLTNVFWHPDSGYVATEFDKKSVVFWNDTTRKKMKTWSFGVERVERGGKMFYQRNNNNRKSSVYDFYFKAYIRNISGGTNSKLNPLNPLTFFIDTIINAEDGSKTDSLYVYDYRENYTSVNFMSQNSGHKGHFNDAAWSNDGSLIASCGSDSIPIIWKTNMSVFARCIGHTDVVNCLKWGPNDKFLATGSKDRTIRIWHPSNGELKRIIDFQDIPTAIVFSRVGDTVAAIGSDTVAHLWDIESGALLRTLRGHTKNITSIEFSPDSKKIITKSVDSTIRIWDLESAEMPQAISDTTWTIIPPGLESREVDCGKSLVSQSKDTVFQNLIKNTSVRPYVIDSIRFTGVHSSDFTLPGKDTATLFLSYETRNMSIRFRPRGAGKRVATINVYVSGTVFSIALTGEGVTNRLAFTENIIDFGSVTVGEHKDTLLALVQNISNAPITFSSIDISLDTSQFHILDGGGITDIGANETHKILLRFSPKTEGTAKAAMTCNYNVHGSPAGFTLTGDGKSSVGVKESITAKDNVSVYPNPADMMINLCCFSGNVQPKITVKDILGNEIYNLNYWLNSDNSLILETRRLPAGLYFVRLYDGTSSQSSLFVVRH